MDKTRLSRPNCKIKDPSGKFKKGVTSQYINTYVGNKDTKGLVTQLTWEAEDNRVGAKRKQKEGESSGQALEN